MSVGARYQLGADKENQKSNETGWSVNRSAPAQHPQLILCCVHTVLRINNARPARWAKAVDRFTDAFNAVSVGIQIGEILKYMFSYRNKVVIPHGIMPVSLIRVKKMILKPPSTKIVKVSNFA